MNEDKFTGKAGIYDSFRPGYPAALFEYLRDCLGFTPGKAVADVGAGTGIFSRGLLDAGLDVTSIEPNPDMRAVMEAHAAIPHWRILPGSAENTLLPPGSQDGVTAAQAFHWFDPEAFRSECRRILRPGSPVALVWNHRDRADPTTPELYEINRRFCPNFKGFAGGMDEMEPERISEFFHGGDVTLKRIYHKNTVTRQGFVGRALSSSYAPKKDDPAYTPYQEAVADLFSKYSDHAQLALRLECRVYWGVVSSSLFHSAKADLWNRSS